MGCMMKMDDINKILIVKLDHIGDLILATPTFRALKERYPASQLDVVVAPKSAPVVNNSPFINRVYYYSSHDFDRTNSLNESVRLENMQTVCSLRSEHYDLCIGLREDLKNIVIQKMFGAKRNISFNTNTVFAEMLDESVRNNESHHSAEINFDLLKIIDVEKPEMIQPEIFINKTEIDWSWKFLDENGVNEEDCLIGISPGGGWFLNWWPYENYIKLVNALWKYNSDLKIVIVGGNAEAKLAKKIKDGLGGTLVDAVGKTSISQMVALFKCMKFVITNDGGPMHMACAAKTPVIALFGPSPYKRFGPLGKDNVVISRNMKCSPCPQFVQGETPKCLDNKCMKNITVEEVYHACLDKLKG